MSELTRELDRLLAAAAGLGEAEQRQAVLGALSSTISRALALRTDELAVLVLSGDRTTLEFVHPAELAEGRRNRFPLTVPSLAGRVVQTGRNILVNAAHEVPHLTFYERIRIKEQRPHQIQKLLAVGVKGPDGKVRAVIEASRRGQTPGEAGPDFRPEDQQLLERLAAAAGPHMATAFGWKS